MNQPPKELMDLARRTAKAEWADDESLDRQSAGQVGAVVLQRVWAAIQEDASAAERIVLALAGLDAPLQDGTYANGDGWCTMCSGEGPDVQAHDEDCPWRQAREYRERVRPS